MKKSILLAILSGILLSLPFSCGSLWIFAWFGFVPVFLALKDRTNAQAFLLFFIAGIIFWILTGWWLVYVTALGTVVLTFYMSLYFGLFGLFIRPCTRRSTLFCLIFIPAAWVMLEYIRGWLFTGLPWALLGYSQYLNLPAIQIADITGTWGISFLIVFVNVCLVEIIYRKRTVQIRQFKQVSVILVLFLILVLSYGFYRIYQRPVANGQRPINISVIQGNIPQELKWNPENAAVTMEKYIMLSTEAARERPDLIIWPEASLPVVPEQEPAYYQWGMDFVRDSGIPLLVGAVTERGDAYYNSAIFLQDHQGIPLRYDKIHLVPFGEYIPLKEALPFLQTIAPIGDIARGRELKVFGILRDSAQPIKFSVLICFEDMFPGLARKFVLRGVDLLVNITNDAWYKISSAPYQHLAASVLRAVENRVNVVRSANTGISCFIAPTGKITSVVRGNSGGEIFVTGYKTQGIEVGSGGISFYCRFGDWFVLLCGLIVLFCAVRISCPKCLPAVPCAPRRQ